MAAFKLAYEQDADGIETDVQLTKDNIPILIHDERVRRTTNSDGYVKDYTYDELLQLDAGSWFSNRFTGETIVSLNQLLQWIQFKNISLNMELKNNKINYKYLESIVFEMINHYQLQKRTTISTFNPTSIQKLKKFNNHVEIALLTSKRTRGNVKYVRELGANALHIKYRLLNFRLVEQCHRENIAVRVYTINKVTHMMRCFELGCDGIFTDLPEQGIYYKKCFNDNI